MSDLALFNGEFGEIRTLDEDGKVLFCGTDVARALGYSVPRKAIRDHCRGVLKRNIGVQTGKRADGSPATQTVELLFIPESDLYRLAFQSKLPGAERFTDWVTEEVLPSIRRVGAYAGDELLEDQAAMSRALEALRVERHRRAVAEQRLEAGGLMARGGCNLGPADRTRLLARVEAYRTENGEDCPESYKRFTALLFSGGVTTRDVARDTGMPAGMFAQWRTGTVLPGDSVLRVISGYFGVDAGYFTED